MKFLSILGFEGDCHHCFSSEYTVTKAIGMNPTQISPAPKPTNWKREESSLLMITLYMNIFYNVLLSDTVIGCELEEIDHKFTLILKIAGTSYNSLLSTSLDDKHTSIDAKHDVGIYNVDKSKIISLCRVGSQQ